MNYVGSWQCAPKARIIYPENCRYVRKLTSGSVGNWLGRSLVTKATLGG